MEKDIPLINCIEHPKLLLSFYCSSHDAIFCENCKAAVHGDCSGVQTIKNASKGVNEKELLPELLTRLSEAKESLSVTTDKLEDNISSLSRQYDSIKQNIHNARRAVNEYFDKLESELTTTVQEKRIKGVEDNILELERRKYILEQWEEELQAAIRSDEEEIIFSMIKILNGLQHDMESYINMVQNDIKISNVRWQPIRTDKASIEAFVGKLSIYETTSIVPRPNTGRSVKTLTRESSGILESHDTISIGTVNIQRESRAEQGLDGISTKTEQGWNETSSKIQGSKIDTTGFGEGLVAPESISGDQQHLQLQHVNGVDGPSSQVNKDKSLEDKKIRREHHIPNGNFDKTSQEDMHSVPGILTRKEAGKSFETKGGKTENIITSHGNSPDLKTKKERVSFNGKSKFEATILDHKTCAEVRKGLFLSNETLLFLDKSNKHIFICNKDGKVQHKINLVYEPQDAAMIDDIRVVITLGDQGIQTINVKSYQKEKAHDVGGCCGGVASYKGQIIVSVDEKLRLLDTFGYTLRRIQHDGSATNVCTDKAGRIYYTDSMNHTVHCLAWYGIPIFTYSNKNLKCPIGIVVDANSFIYVAGFESSNVQKLWSNGHLHSEFLSEKDDVYEPSSLAYNDVENELLVISDNNQSIETYNLNGHSRPQQ